MGFIAKQLRQGTLIFFLGMLWFGFTIFAILDMFYKVTPNGNSIIYVLTLSAIILGVIAVKKIQESNRQLRFRQALKNELAIYEATREKEIRAIYAENPEFATHCFQCQEYDDRVKHCGRNLSQDPMQHHVRSIRIGVRPFCLYWKPADGAPDTVKTFSTTSINTNSVSS